jgi:acyl-CoA thioesterase-1
MGRLLIYTVRLLVLALAMTLATWAHAKPIQIVALGDSNTAGFLVGKRNAFPALLEKDLREDGYDVSIANRGISGDTTEGMLSRLERAVLNGTSIAIVQGGYNDKRRGISPEIRDANIEAILANLTSRGVKVVLCGLPEIRPRTLEERCEPLPLRSAARP